MYRYSAEDTLTKRCYYFVALLDCGAYEAAEGTAVLLVDINVVCHVYQTTGQITRVRGL